MGNRYAALSTPLAMYKTMNSMLVDSRRAPAQVELAHEQNERWDADHAEGRERERAHRDGHLAADAGQLAHILAVRPRVYGACAEDQRDLRYAVAHDVEQRSDERSGAQQRSAEHDVGEVGHGRVREPPLEVVLPQRDRRRQDYRRGGEPRDDLPRAHVAQYVGAKHEHEHAQRRRRRPPSRRPPRATAPKRAFGATIAAGSQLCSGMSRRLHANAHPQQSPAGPRE